MKKIADKWENLDFAYLWCPKSAAESVVKTNTSQSTRSVQFGLASFSPVQLWECKWHRVCVSLFLMWIRFYLRPCIHGLIILIKSWSHTKQIRSRSKTWRWDFENSTVRRSTIFKSNSLGILIVPLFSLIKISSTFNPPVTIPWPVRPDFFF